MSRRSEWINYESEAVTLRNLSKLGLGPIIMWTVLGSSAIASGITSMPSALNASTSAIPAPAAEGVPGGSSPTLRPTATPEAEAAMPSMRPSGLTIPPPGPMLHRASSQPALARAGSINVRRRRNSGSRKATARSYFVPGNGVNFSMIRSTCSGSSIRGMLYIANSSRTCSALWFASAARALACSASASDDATLSSERRCNSAWAIERLPPKLISPAIATASNRLHVMRSAVSNGGLSPEYWNNTTASKISATMTVRSQKFSLREFSSTSRLSAASVLCAMFTCIGFLRVGQNRHYTPSRRERLVNRILWLLPGIVVILLILMRHCS
jgi:hypothetical protein